MHLQGSGTHFSVFWAWTHLDPLDPTWTHPGGTRMGRPRRLRARIHSCMGLAGAFCLPAASARACVFLKACSSVRNSGHAAVGYYARGWPHFPRFARLRFGNPCANRLKPGPLKPVKPGPLKHTQLQCLDPDHLLQTLAATSTPVATLAHRLSGLGFRV